MSKTVTVDANKTYDVRLRFEYYVFKSGSGFQNGFSKLSGGMAYNELSIYSPNENSPQICISPAIDLNNYETLYVDWQHYTSSSTPRFGISTGTSNSLLTQVQRPNNTRGVSEIDVSNITGSYYIRVAGNYTTATVYNIWLL